MQEKSEHGGIGGSGRGRNPQIPGHQDGHGSHRYVYNANEFSYHSSVGSSHFQRSSSLLRVLLFKSTLLFGAQDFFRMSQACHCRVWAWNLLFEKRGSVNFGIFREGYGFKEVLFLGRPCHTLLLNGFWNFFLVWMLLAMQAEAVPLVEELKLVEDSDAEMYAFLPFHVFVHQ